MCSAATAKALDGNSDQARHNTVDSFRAWSPFITTTSAAGAGNALRLRIEPLTIYDMLQERLCRRFNHNTG
jgi:hypothetical protein